MCEYITYKGQEFPLIYDWYAQSRLLMAREEAESKNKTLSIVDSTEITLFYSIEAGCEALDRSFTIKKKDASGKEVEMPLSMKDVAFMIGAVGQEEINDKLSKFLPKNEDDEDEAKKKKPQT